MEIITLILSGLALLAASVCLVLVCQEKKRSKKRNAALVRYVDKTRESVESKVGTHAEECIKKCIERIEKLEDGVVPDFEQAKATAEAVNEFSKGIANILGFDPVSALQAERKKERYGEAE